MAEHRTQFEFKTIKAIRGTESRTISKWEGLGWELEKQIAGRLRTEIVLRRRKPKSAAERLAVAWTAFRRLRPNTQRGLVAACGAVVAAAVLGIVLAPHDEASEAQPIARQTVAAVASDATPVVKATATPTSMPTTAAEPSVLTWKNNAELAAILKSDEPSDDAVAAFAEKYAGRTIAFNGDIAALNLHGDYRTRYDLLIHYGTYSTTRAQGPEFQFRNVNLVSDLHLTGANIPDTLQVGDSIRVVAEVGEFESGTGLFLLTPVSTEVR